MTKPAPTKTIAEVIPRRSSGAENAPQTMMMVVMVASATIVHLFSPDRPPSDGARPSYSRWGGQPKAEPPATAQRARISAEKPDRVVT
jgi:hypothetical protein